MVRGPQWWVENVRELSVRDYRVHWPTYPIDSSDVELLRSPNRNANSEYYGDLDRVLSGNAAPPFSAMWARNVTGRVETGWLRGSMPEVPAVVGECEGLSFVD